MANLIPMETGRRGSVVDPNDVEIETKGGGGASRAMSNFDRKTTTQRAPVRSMSRLQRKNIHIRADLVNSKNQSGRVQPMKDQKMSDLTRLLQEWDKKIGSGK